MSTDLDEKVDTRIAHDEGDHERLSHYVSKAALEQAIFDGIPTLALCGKLWLPTKDPQRFSVCPECADVFAQMRDE